MRFEERCKAEEEREPRVYCGWEAETNERCYSADGLSNNDGCVLRFPNASGICNLLVLKILERSAWPYGKDSLE